MVVAANQRERQVGRLWRGLFLRRQSAVAGASGYFLAVPPNFLDPMANCGYYYLVLAYQREANIGLTEQATCLGRIRIVTTQRDVAK